MSVTVTEAHAVNVVLDWIFPDGRTDSRTPSSDDLREALRALATSANKRLMAGWSPEQVDRQVLPAQRRRRRRAP
ncbi:MAG: hypothetical protein M9894_16300 [Planctomycetes bacterium]|nr:hypothetical protein [Planctomycetota bacterium]